jgi:hypothetical protein
MLRDHGAVLRKETTGQETRVNEPSTIGAAIITARRQSHLETAFIAEF